MLTQISTERSPVNRRDAHGPRLSILSRAAPAYYLPGARETSAATSGRQLSAQDKAEPGPWLFCPFHGTGAHMVGDNWAQLFTTMCHALCWHSSFCPHHNPPWHTLHPTGEDTGSERGDRHEMNSSGCRKGCEGHTRRCCSNVWKKDLV